MRIFYPLMFPLLAVLIWATNTVVSKAAADVLDPAATPGASSASSAWG